MDQIEETVKLYIHPTHNVPGDTTASDRLEKFRKVYKDRVSGF